MKEATKLTHTTLGNLQAGAIGAVIDDAINRCMQDCEARSGPSTSSAYPRTVGASSGTLKCSCTPPCASRSVTRKKGLVHSGTGFRNSGCSAYFSGKAGSFLL